MCICCPVMIRVGRWVLTAMWDISWLYTRVCVSHVHVNKIAVVK